MRIRTGFVLGLLLTLSMAGCGQSDSGAQVATAGTAAATASATAARSDTGGLAFAQCMREHGVDIPDPQDNGRVEIRLPQGVDPQKAQAATEQCKRHLPNGGEAAKADPQAVEQQRAFAQCMRDNGVERFPDPDASGGFQIGPEGGVDPNDPKVQAAQQECAELRPAPPSGGPSDAPTIGSDG
ncbi:hypothetical protein [Nonomuraea sp. bgisy101]|uniref:hypothetical protein n=1 Tax=Nonomuraea sp. bgisy101 TaxID=3413784 RepID=UPI003D75325A